MSQRRPFKEFLTQSENPIVADGGMTTSLYDKGFYINRSFEELSVTAAEAVREVTQGFQQAGAQILSANTFGATIPKLKEYGLQDRLQEIIQAAVKIAKDVAGDEQYVVGVLGPIGLLLEPLGPTSYDEAVSLFGDNVRAMDAAGVDGISIQGIHDLKEMRAAIQAVREHSSLAVMAHLGIQENMKTSFGHSLKEFVELCEEFDVEALGFAGEVGPSGMLTATERVRGETKRPISIMPNAGLPRYVNDQYIYLCNPDYMGKYAKRIVQAGADIVGGHAGVNEHHIRAVTNALRMTQGLRARSVESHVSALQPVNDKPCEKKPLAERSRLGKKLEAGERVVSVELVPPKGVDFEKFLKHIRELEKGGVEFVNIPDGARAVARMSSLHMSAYVASHFQIEPIPHFTARDRNLLGLQADLLGAYVNGVKNVLLVTGDPPKLGNCPGASGVYDVDAIGMTHIVSRLNQGLDLGGSSFGTPTGFATGVAVNPTAANQELEIQRYKYKIEAGAEFAISQPIYDVDACAKFFEKLGDVKIPVIMGIWPLVSLRNAEFLKNEVPGVEVPDWAMAEMEKAGDDKEEAVKRGLEIAVNTMEKAKSLVQGFQVSAPFNRVKVALDAIHAIDSETSSDASAKVE